MEKVLCSNVMGYTEFIEKIKKMSESVMKQEHCARLQSMQRMKQEPVHLNWSSMMISIWTAVQLTRLIQQVRRCKRLY